MTRERFFRSLRDLREDILQVKKTASCHCWGCQKGDLFLYVAGILEQLLEEDDYQDFDGGDWKREFDSYYDWYLKWESPGN